MATKTESELDRFKKLVVETAINYPGGCPDGKEDFLGKLGLSSGETVTVTANVTFRLSVEKLDGLSNTQQLHEAVAQAVADSMAGHTRGVGVGDRVRNDLPQIGRGYDARRRRVKLITDSVTAEVTSMAALTPIGEERPILPVKPAPKPRKKAPPKA